jgi:hypothetical protein
VLTTLLALILAANTAIAGQQPQLAHDQGRVYLVVAREGQVGVLRSSDEGRSFRQVTPIAVSGRMSAGMHRGPRVAVTRSSVLVAVIAGAQGGGKDGDVILHRSTDEGATWAAPVVVNDVPAAAREGLHAMAATPDGLVVITWLDLRQKGTRLYGAVSRDHGVTWGADVLVQASPDGSICECCHPSVAVDSARSIAVMFRNHVAGARDLYVTRSQDGQTFSTAEKQGTGTWMLEACPMDGGGLTLDAMGTASVWRRQDGIFLTTPSQPERRIGTGRDPAIAAGPAGLDVAWVAPDGIQLHRGDTVLAIGAGKAPALLSFPSHTLVAWEQQGQVVTKVVVR